MCDQARRGCIRCLASTQAPCDSPREPSCCTSAVLDHPPALTQGSLAANVHYHCITTALPSGAPECSTLPLHRVLESSFDRRGSLLPPCTRLAVQCPRSDTHDLAGRSPDLGRSQAGCMSAAAVRCPARLFTSMIPGATKPRRVGFISGGAL